MLHFFSILTVLSAAFSFSGLSRLYQTRDAIQPADLFLTLIFVTIFIVALIKVFQLNREKRRQAEANSQIAEKPKSKRQLRREQARAEKIAPRPKNPPSV